MPVGHRHTTWVAVMDRSGAWIFEKGPLDVEARPLYHYLEEGRGQNRFEHLILVAESHFLGLVRGALGPQLLAKLIDEIEKNWANLSDVALAEKVSSLLSAQETMD